MSLLSLTGRRSVPLSQITATSIYQFVIGCLVLVVGSLSIVSVKFKEERDVALAESRGYKEGIESNGQCVVELIKLSTNLTNQLKKKDTRVAYLPNPIEVK